MSDQQTPDYLESTDSMLAVIKRAQNGDAGAVPAVRDLLDRVPELRCVMGGELQEIVDSVVSRSLGGEDDLAFREATRSKLEALRRELEGPDASPLERLLVDRVVACWLQVQEADFRMAQLRECGVAQAEFFQKRQDRAHRRFLTAIKTLAQVRKMALPILQVNIAENQQVCNTSS